MGCKHLALAAALAAVPACGALAQDGADLLAADDFVLFDAAPVRGDDHAGGIAVVPFLGGGLGGLVVLQRGFDAPRLSLQALDSDGVPAYRATAGLAVTLDEHLSATLGYGFLATDEADMGYPRSVRDENYQAHTLKLGFRLRF